MICVIINSVTQFVNPPQQERKRLQAIQEKEKQQQDDDEEEEQDFVPSSMKLPRGRGVLIKNVNVEKKVRKLEKERIEADESQFLDVEENVSGRARGRSKGRGRIVKKINGE